MPQSLSCIYVHGVFSTKHRQPWLTEDGFRKEVFAYVGGVSSRLGCSPVVVGGVADHVHILAILGRTISVAEWIKETKRVSSIFVKERIPAFAWQSGYGSFSVDPLKLDRVAQYIRSQEEHHHCETFQEEFLRLLRDHSLEWDERYVWD